MTGEAAEGVLDQIFTYTHTQSDFHRGVSCLTGRWPLLKYTFLAINSGKKPSLKHCIQTELQVFLRKKSLALK